MRYVLWAMLVVFVIAGALLILNGIRGLWTMALRRGKLLKSVGTVRQIEKKYVRFTLNKGASSRPRFSFLPIIVFTKDSGELVEFRSEVGDYGHETKYRIGQTIDVLYDPSGVLQPMIDSWFARWGTNFLIIVVGMVFWAGAALVYWLIGQVILHSK
jgi:hypothetical protein